MAKTNCKISLGAAVFLLSHRAFWLKLPQSGLRSRQSLRFQSLFLRTEWTRIARAWS